MNSNAAEFGLAKSALANSRYQRPSNRSLEAASFFAVACDSGGDVQTSVASQGR
jgi:hypothetical protein